MLGGMSDVRFGGTRVLVFLRHMRHFSENIYVNVSIDSTKIAQTTELFKLRQIADVKCTYSAAAT